MNDNIEMSSYQKDIFDYYNEHPHDNMIIEASAGSGKTQTALMLLSNTKTRDIYVAFNTGVADEFKKKIKNKNVKVSTVHALAYSFMVYNISELYVKAKIDYGKPTLNNFKIYNIVDKIIEKQFGKIDFNSRVFLRQNFYDLYNLCRLCLVNFGDLEHIHDLIEDHEIFKVYSKNDNDKLKVPELSQISQVLSLINAESLDEFERLGTIDFTDMLYITYWYIKNKKWKVPYWGFYQNVIIDEHQDQNQLQTSFLFFIKKKDGRYVIIQDRYQAIYFFAGADAKGAEMAYKIYAPCAEFKLPICYRCPKSHLNYVKKQFPYINIKPRDDAPIGDIKHINKDEIPKYISPGDMVISRKNSWLGSVIYDLLKHNFKIYMEDKELITNLKKLVNYKKYPQFGDFKKYLDKQIADYKDAVKTQKNKSAELSGEEFTKTFNQVVEINSKIDNVKLLRQICKYYSSNNSNSSATMKLTDYIDNLLSQEYNEESIRITSVHKAKGLEAENVFVLNEGEVCKAISFDQIQQEKNLSYISLTRAKNNLYLVSENNDESYDDEKVIFENDGEFLF